MKNLRDVPKAIQDLFALVFGPPGRMLPGSGASKTMYAMANPDEDVLWDHIVFSERTNGPVWWGDVSLTNESDRLQLIADDLGPICLVSRATVDREEPTLYDSAVQLSTPEHVFEPQGNKHEQEARRTAFLTG